MSTKKYDTTLARIAGNIAAGLFGSLGLPSDEDVDHVKTYATHVAHASVDVAYVIVRRLEDDAKQSELVSDK